MNDLVRIKVFTTSVDNGRTDDQSLNDKYNIWMKEYEGDATPSIISVDVSSNRWTYIMVVRYNLI